MPQHTMSQTWFLKHFSFKMSSLYLNSHQISAQQSISVQCETCIMDVQPINLHQLCEAVLSISDQNVSNNLLNPCCEGLSWFLRQNEPPPPLETQIPFGVAPGRAFSINLCHIKPVGAPLLARE